jgi:hypothetical protein
MFFLVMNLVVSRFSIQAQDLTLSVNYFAFENKKHSEYSSDVEYSSINKEENILSKEKNLVQPKQFNLIVMYESDALWAQVFTMGKHTKTGNQKMNEIMESYDLTLTEQIKIDEYNKCIVLEINNILDTPKDAARELSLVENVVMVYVEELSQKQTSGVDHKLSQY